MRGYGIVGLASDSPDALGHAVAVYNIALQPLDMARCFGARSNE